MRLLFITHADIAAGVCKAFSRVCFSVCLSVHAVTGKRLELSTPNLVYTYILYSSRSACIDPEVKRSKVKVTRYKNRNGHTVANDHHRYSVYLYAAVRPAAVAGMGLHVDTIAYVF